MIGNDKKKVMACKIDSLCGNIMYQRKGKCGAFKSAWKCSIELVTGFCIGREQKLGQMIAPMFLGLIQQFDWTSQWLGVDELHGIAHRSRR